MDFTMTFYTINGDFKPGCAIDLWTRELKAFLITYGLEPEPGPKLKRWVTDSGFQNIHEKRMALPVGMWPKEKRMVSVTFISLLVSPCTSPFSLPDRNHELILIIAIEGGWDCQFDPVS